MRDGVRLACAGRGIHQPHKPGNYYTEFVKRTPKDTVALTLACGKYRFNDLNISEINGLPRIMDMGQCNGAYGAIQVAFALANALNCAVHDLPYPACCPGMSRRRSVSC